MPRDRLLSASILALAAAVALHGLAPALAEEPAPPVAPPVAGPAPLPMARTTPECRNVRVGTAKEVAGLMADLQAKGHAHFMTVGTGLVCGWQ
jgi:hypothetical protein